MPLNGLIRCRTELGLVRAGTVIVS